MEAERKLSAIFASDVVGFSKMMANDEHKTLELLHNRREVIDSLIDNNGGKSLFILNSQNLVSLIMLVI